MEVQTIHIFLKERNKNIASLVFCWFFGFVIGVYLSFSQDSVCISLMHSVLTVQVSFVGLATSVFIPFILSAFAVYLHLTVIIRMICILKAMATGYCVVSLILLFQVASWVLCLLLLFADSLYQVFLFRFWIRNSNGVQDCFVFDCVSCAGIGTLAVLIQYLFITPVLQGIF